MNRTFIFCLQNLFSYRFSQERHLIVKPIYNWTTINDTTPLNDIDNIKRCNCNP